MLIFVIRVDEIFLKIGSKKWHVYNESEYDFNVLQSYKVNYVRLNSIDIYCVFRPILSIILNNNA